MPKHNGSYAAYSLYFAILCHDFAHFGGPGTTAVAGREAATKMARAPLIGRAHYFQNYQSQYQN